MDNCRLPCFFFFFSFLFFYIFMLLLPSHHLAVAFNLESLGVDEFLKEVNPPALSKLKDLNGDTFLCVRFEDQISVKHSKEKVWKPSREELQLHRLQLKEMMNDDASVVKEEQEGQDVGLSCPEGTVAIRETKRDNVERSRSSSSSSGMRPYATKYHSPLPFSNSSLFPLSFNDVKLAGQENIPIITEYAVASHGGGSYGAFYGRINAYQPYIMEKTRSTAQVWVQSGGEGKDPIQVIEAGWQANPSRYGDKRPRFFVYWTNDNYGKTGCFDLDCPGFVALPGIGSTWIGKPYPEVSQVNGKKVDYALMISQMDPSQGKPGWFLFVEGYLVGYWPQSLFTSMKKSARLVHWGGQVAYPFYKARQRHTPTEMGSGWLPSMGYEKCAYINEIKIWSADMKTYIATAVFTPYVSRAGCYDARVRDGLLPIEPLPPSANGHHLFFGGPGYSFPCLCAEREGRDCIP